MSCRTYHKYGSCVEDASAETSCFNVSLLQAPYEVSLRNFTSKYAEVCTQYIRSTGNNASSSPGHQPLVRDIEDAPAAAKGFALRQTSRTVVYLCLSVLVIPLLLSLFGFQHYL